MPVGLPQQALRFCQQRHPLGLGKQQNLLSAAFFILNIRCTVHHNEISLQSFVTPEQSLSEQCRMKEFLVRWHNKRGSPLINPGLKSSSKRFWSSAVGIRITLSVVLGNIAMNERCPEVSQELTVFDVRSVLKWTHKGRPNKCNA